MQPVDLPLTFSGHPDQAPVLEAIELFGIRVRGNLPTDTDKRAGPILDGLEGEKDE